MFHATGKSNKERFRKGPVVLAPALMLVTSREKLHLSCGDTDSLRNKWKRVAGSRDSE